MKVSKFDQPFDKFFYFTRPDGMEVGIGTIFDSLSNLAMQGIYRPSWADLSDFNTGFYYVYSYLEGDFINAILQNQPWAGGGTQWDGQVYNPPGLTQPNVFTWPQIYAGSPVYCADGQIRTGQYGVTWLFEYWMAHDSNYAVEYCTIVGRNAVIIPKLQELYDSTIGAIPNPPKPADLPPLNVNHDYPPVTIGGIPNAAVLFIMMDELLTAALNPAHPAAATLGFKTPTM